MKYYFNKFDLNRTYIKYFSYKKIKIQHIKLKGFFVKIKSFEDRNRLSVFIQQLLKNGRYDFAFNVVKAIINKLNIKVKSGKLQPNSLFYIINGIRKIELAMDLVPVKKKGRVRYKKVHSLALQKRTSKAVQLLLNYCREYARKTHQSLVSVLIEEFSDIWKGQSSVLRSQNLFIRECFETIFTYKFSKSYFLQRRRLRRHKHILFVRGSFFFFHKRTSCFSLIKSLYFLKFFLFFFKFRLSLNWSVFFIKGFFKSIRKKLTYQNLTFRYFFFNILKKLVYYKKIKLKLRFLVDSVKTVRLNLFFYKFYVYSLYIYSKFYKYFNWFLIFNVFFICKLVIFNFNYYFKLFLNLYCRRYLKNSYRKQNKNKKKLSEKKFLFWLKLKFLNNFLKNKKSFVSFYYVKNVYVIFYKNIICNYYYILFNLYKFFFINYFNWSLLKNFFYREKKFFISFYNFYKLNIYLKKINVVHINYNYIYYNFFNFSFYYIRRPNILLLKKIRFNFLKPSSYEDFNNNSSIDGAEDNFDYLSNVELDDFPGNLLKLERGSFVGDRIFLNFLKRLNF